MPLTEIREGGKTLRGQFIDARRWAERADCAAGMSVPLMIGDRIQNLVGNVHRCEGCVTIDQRCFAGLNAIDETPQFTGQCIGIGNRRWGDSGQRSRLDYRAGYLR